MASQASSSRTKNIFKSGANKWKFVKSFESLKEAQKSIGDDWKKRYSNTSTIGDLRMTTSVYYCFHHGKTCKAKLQLVYPELNGSASYFELEVMDHGDLTQKLKSGLSYSQKEVIRHVVEQSRGRPNGILRTIETLKLCDVPIKKKLCQFVKNERKKVNSAMIYLSDLTNWCTTRVIIPEDDDKPYVVAFNAVVMEDENKCVFHVAITTNRLLRLLKLSDVIHIDATSYIFVIFMQICPTTEIKTQIDRISAGRNT